MNAKNLLSNDHTLTNLQTRSSSAEKHHMMVAQKSIFGGAYMCFYRAALLCWHQEMYLPYSLLKAENFWIACYGLVRYVYVARMK